MRFIFPAVGILLSAFLLMQPGAAQAQTWKRLCVSGGATGGANNGTWQKINTPSAGGGTWKKAGGCTIPPPPVPLNPFEGARLQTGIQSGCQNDVTNFATIHGDGTWDTGAINCGFSLEWNSSGNTLSGRWYAPGRTFGEFEIYYADPYVYADYPTDFVVSTPPNQWVSMPSSWRVSLRDLRSGCEGPSVAEINIVLRLKADPSQTMAGRIRLITSGYHEHCYG